MADRPITPIPDLAPVPRRKKRRHQDMRRDMHRAKPGNICLYVVGPCDERVSKVGVSTTPYNRMDCLRVEFGEELLMCYFAELPRQVGFQVESMFHQHCKANNLNLKGEWVAMPRHGITKALRRMMKEVGATPTCEVGDCGDDRITDAVNDIGNCLDTAAFQAGVTPPKRR